MPPALGELPTPAGRTAEGACRRRDRTAVSALTPRSGVVVSVSLSRSAVARVQRASEMILLSATDDSPATFRLGAAREIRDLLDADRSVCFLPLPGLRRFASEDFTNEFLTELAG